MCWACMYDEPPRECDCVPDGSIVVTSNDLAWLSEKAELGLDLDAFVTTQADRDRLKEIKDKYDL